MAGSPPDLGGSQDSPGHTKGSPESRRQTSTQQPYRIPSQQPPQYYHQPDSSGTMRMASLQSALPNVQPPGYPPNPRYSAMSPTAEYPVRVPPPAGTYHGFPQSPTHPMAVAHYPTYLDQHGHVIPYSHAQQHFSGQPVYAPHVQHQQYGMYPPGYGPPSPVQHRGYPAHVGQEHGPGTGYPAGLGSTPLSPSIPAAPRGPPRKPKQSGHALWVGNLPPATRVNDLKDHFSRDATKEIESVFLISKSNCAFVNYRSEEACTAAMARFHDSRFQGVRLVTRLRKTPGSSPSPAGSGAPIPSGPAAQQQSQSTPSQASLDAIVRTHESPPKAAETGSMADAAVNDKYFVVKSLTVEDLELSSRNGIWATQGHNEAALNKAYEAVENVYLIFSANKSGEYFGYARMASSINDETAKTLEWKQQERGTRSEFLRIDPDLPRSIPTPATEWAPKGRIIDDSARGTIFWEADSDDIGDDSREGPADGEVDFPGNQDEGKADEDEEEEGDEEDERGEAATGTGEHEVAGSRNSPAGELEEASHQPFGRPFRVQWISTNRLPFYRTRGLRNAWNSNREVKIARDGTELETSIGRRLVSMFHRGPIPVTQMPQPQQYMSQHPVAMGYGMLPYGGRY